MTDKPETTEKAPKIERRQFRAIKGTRDILPPDSALWNWFEQSAREVFESYNFRDIRLPIFEETSLFARAVGTDTDIVGKEMYTFTTLEPETEKLNDLRSIVLGWPDLWDRQQFEAYKRTVELFVQAVEQAMNAPRIPADRDNRTVAQNLKNHAHELMGVSPQHATDFVERVRADARALELGQITTLRPEATASVCRAYIEHGMQTLPGVLSGGRRSSGTIRCAGDRRRSARNAAHVFQLRRPNEYQAVHQFHRLQGMPTEIRGTAARRAAQSERPS